MLQYKIEHKPLKSSKMNIHKLRILYTRYRSRSRNSQDAHTHTKLKTFPPLMPKQSLYGLKALLLGSTDQMGKRCCRLHGSAGTLHQTSHSSDDRRCTCTCCKNTLHGRNEMVKNLPCSINHVSRRCKHAQLLKQREAINV